MSEAVYVFMGPTLSIKQAQTILPDAVYLPPVKSGDILALLPLKPTCIVMIDGYFQSTPAVWHKEILLALEQGINVIGASSMGALRAAELHMFGMLGIGCIYQKFIAGEYEDDDEVAISHLPEEKGYGLLSEPMVNIRATLAKACERAVIEETQAAIFIAAAKQLHFKERTWPALFSAFPIAENQRTALLLCRTDIKQIDARQALAFVNSGLKAQGVTFESVEKTKYLRNLMRMVLCGPCPLYTPYLPERFRVSYFSRLLGCDWVNLISRCAKALSIVYGWQHQNKISSFEDYVCSAIQKCKAVMQNNPVWQSERMLHAHMPKTDITQRLNALSAWAMSQVQSKIVTDQISMSESRIKKFSDEFRSLHHLSQQADFEQWLKQSGFSCEQYVDAVEYGAVAQYILAGNDDFCVSVPDCQQPVFVQLLLLLGIDQIIMNKIQSTQPGGLPQEVSNLLLQEGISESLFGHYLSIEQAQTK